MSRSATIDRLRCEYLVDPLGIDELCPRFSWVMRSDRRGARQAAFEVQVASAPEILAAGRPDVWTSGRVASDQSLHVEYAGPALLSRQRCWWRVLVEDETGATLVSPVASWSMGLLHAADWQAHWITHDPEVVRRDPAARSPTATEPGTVPLFRKSFRVPGPVKRAALYASARGLVDLSLNGRRVTADEFVPEWTDYHRRLHYRTFDVAALVEPGPNALGAMLGDGWWSGFIGWQERRGQYGTLENSLLVQLEIETDAGETVVVTSDRTWTCDAGPILAGDFMLGETYDARREQPGWDRRGFDDARWLPAIEVAPPTTQNPHYVAPHDDLMPKEVPETKAWVAGGECSDPPVTVLEARSGGSVLLRPQILAGEPLLLAAQRSEPVRTVQRMTPVSFDEPAPGVAVYDLGQNIAGCVELRVSGPPGTRVQLRHGERLNPDGTLYTENLRRATATDVYVLRGSTPDAPEVWRPRFAFHGFQYVEATGLPEPLPVDAVTACVLMSATPEAGRFECSDRLVNRLAENIAWGQRGNFLSVPTDCPQRDERLGWMGDAQVFLRTATCQSDVAAFFTKWMTDVCDSQDADGVFPDVAPRISEGANFVGLDGLAGAAGWADAGVIVPWTLWRVYDDLRLAERHWKAMVAWIEWLECTNPDGIRSRRLGNNYGDWLCIPSDTTFRTHSPMKTLLATAYWADDAAKLAQLARALDKPAEADRFDAMFRRVRDAFRREWLGDDGRLTVDTQTAYLLALEFDLLPEQVRPRAVEHLVENIAQLDWRLSTGFIGVGRLNPRLTLAGRADVAYRLLLSREYPSWLYPVLHGATTIWERWNGWTAEDGFFNPQMNSFNHYSLGSVGEWLYRHVAGIELAPTVNAFKDFVIRPYLGAGLAHAAARYDGPHGEIAVRWERTDSGELLLEAVVPANTTATISVPASRAATIFEGDLPAAASPGLVEAEREDDYANFRATAGRYRFRVVGCA
ncbi:MAG: family 78 glycoside hydrolase catalytic domain [Pirellulales bacterium]|nr:family 78 glycoside hydrolase catalytic domain [Pirellulales bacterium]